MITTVTQRLAQQIVDTVKDICERDINFIDQNGIIFASTNQKRIHDFLEIGKRVADTQTMIEVTADDTFSGTGPGMNMRTTGLADGPHMIFAVSVLLS